MNMIYSKIKNYYFIIIGISLGSLYWVADSYLDALVSGNTLSMELYNLNMHMLYEWLIVTFLFIAFSAYARYIITKRKHAEEQIKASLKEKEVLLREIHHRVKNNMQIISSLLKLQAGYIEDKKYLEMFKESQNRILTMSLVHEKLYRSKDFTKINFKEYIHNLANGVFQSYSGRSSNILLNLNIENVELGIDSAIPCGLIINELVTNSLKHAFPGEKKGEIKIVLGKIDGNEYELTVSDNGIGIPEDIDFRKTETLGLHLVSILAEDQLSGKIKLDRSRGTEFSIRFGGS